MRPLVQLSYGYEPADPSPLADEPADPSATARDPREILAGLSLQDDSTLLDLYMLI